MSLSVRSITVDCLDPYRLALWWCEVLGVPPCPDDHPGDPVALCSLGVGRTRLLFERVPEAKSGKNRVHVDLDAGIGRDEEVERLLRLGASFVTDHRPPTTDHRPPTTDHRPPTTDVRTVRAGSCSPIPRETSSASNVGRLTREGA